MQYDLIIMSHTYLFAGIPQGSLSAQAPHLQPAPTIHQHAVICLELVSDTQIEGGEVHGLGGDVNGINTAIAVVHL